MQSTDFPPVPVLVELASIFGPGEALELAAEDCTGAVAAKLDHVLDALGIPGRATVRVAFDARLTPSRPLRLTINDGLCRYADELLLWTAGYVAGDHPRPGAAVADVLAPIGASSGATSDGVNRTSAGFVATACEEIAKATPAALFALPQAEAYAAALAPFSGRGNGFSTWPPAPAWLLMILGEVIAQRVPIADCSLVAVLLAERGASEDRVAIVEELIAALSACEVEVQVSPADDDLVVDDEPKSVAERFAFVREGLFVETGVEYPSFTRVVADDLPGGTFAFKIGCLRTTPTVRLKPDECLVNDTAERLNRVREEWLKGLPGIAARPALNPATGQPAAIAPADSRSALVASGLTVWDAREHLILCMADALRRHGACCVNTNLAGSRLRFTQSAYPALARAITSEQYTDAQVARILRRLVAEGISIRNTRLIGDLLLEHADLRRDERRLLERVRAGLCRVIRDKFARGSDTVTVYLLDPRVEEHLAAQRWRRRPEETLCEAILGPIRAEIQELRRIAPTALVPSILTTTQARSALQAVVAREFPRLSVLSYDDLPRDTNIMPVARIMLAS